MEEGSVARSVCVVRRSSVGSACAAAASSEVLEWIYSKIPEIIEQRDGGVFWNTSRAVLSVREIVSRAISLDFLTSRMRLFEDLTSALGSERWPLVNRPFKAA